MSIARPEDLIVTEIVGDLEIPCDFSDDPICGDSPAHWVLFKHCPGCHDRKALLACDNCKDARMSSECGVICQSRDGGGCGELIAPARKAYERVEAL